MSDHYQELVIAGIERWGWEFSDALEVEILNDAAFRCWMAITDLPPTLASKEFWRANRRLPGGEFEWSCQKDCDVCSGEGQLTALGKNGKDYDVECPSCYGDGSDGPDATIITDAFGRYLRTVP